MLTLVSGAEGRFRLQLAPGRYRVSGGTLPDFEPVAAQDVDAVAGRTTSVVLTYVRGFQ